MRLAFALLALAGGFAYDGEARGDAPTLSLSFGGEPRSFTSAELLARPDTATLAIPANVAYGRAMTFRAVPLLALTHPSTPSRRARPTASCRSFRAR